MKQVILLSGLFILAGSVTVLAHPGHSPPREQTEAPDQESAAVSGEQLMQFARALKAIEALHQQAPPLAEAGTRAEAARRQGALEEQMRQVLHNLELPPQRFRQLRQQIARDPALKQRVTAILAKLPPPPL